MRESEISFYFFFLIKRDTFHHWNIPASSQKAHLITLGTKGILDDKGYLKGPRIDKSIDFSRTGKLDSSAVKCQISSVMRNF